MWSDNETDEDLLGFSIHANLIKEIVTNSEMLPVTVGLFGDWGGGKSSILKILNQDISTNNDFSVIYFNSWVFEGYEDAKIAILTSLLTELQRQRNWDAVIKDEIGSLLKRVQWMKVVKSCVSAGLAYATANPLLLAGMESPFALKKDKASDDQAIATMEKIEPDNYLKDVEETVHNVRSFRRDFQSLINKTKLKAFVILIDDLDRCSPERVIENLEAIKLFLNVENTAFVIATDRRIVENAIRVKYPDLFSGKDGDSSEQEALVTDYLEKLIQIPYTLPKLAPHEVRSYMSFLFLKKHLPSEKFNELRIQYSAFLTRERYSAFPLDDTLQSLPDGANKTALIECVRLVESCSDAITDGLKGNPRQIKRFLNAYWFRKKLADTAKLLHIKDHILIKLMVLEYISSDCFEELYSLHRYSPDGTVETLGIIEDAETPDDIEDKFANWKSPRIWKWLKSEPSLSRIDLRDYFWLSRTSITDTLSGVRLLSQAMRQCVDVMLSDSQTSKNRVALYSSLSTDEQSGVVAMVAKKAMQNPDDDTPLNSLFDLAIADFENAAIAFKSSAVKIGPSQLKPGLGIRLRSAKFPPSSPVSGIISSLIADLVKTDTKIGRALGLKKQVK
ncbi:MAG: KAP family NTPase [Kiritimatiellaeota bacterium]|nr:KAP family NTPase [Kiritimatiellota bacterium]